MKKSLMSLVVLAGFLLPSCGPIFSGLSDQAAETLKERKTIIEVFEASHKCPPCAAMYPELEKLVAKYFPGVKPRVEMAPIPVVENGNFKKNADGKVVTKTSTTIELSTWSNDNFQIQIYKMMHHDWNDPEWEVLKKYRKLNGVPVIRIHQKLSDGSFKVFEKAKTLVQQQPVIDISGFQTTRNVNIRIPAKKYVEFSGDYRIQNVRESTLATIRQYLDMTHPEKESVKFDPLHIIELGNLGLGNLGQASAVSVAPAWEIVGPATDSQGGLAVRLKSCEAGGICSTKVVSATTFSGFISSNSIKFADDVSLAKRQQFANEFNLSDADRKKLGL